MEGMLWSCLIYGSYKTNCGEQGTGHSEAKDFALWQQMPFSSTTESLRVLFEHKGMNRDLAPSSNAGQGLLGLNMMWVEPARAWLANVQSSIVILLCGGEKWTIATDLFYSILNIALSFHRS